MNNDSESQTAVTTGDTICHVCGQKRRDPGSNTCSFVHGEVAWLAPEAETTIARELAEALKGLSAMYANTWDLVDGCLLMMKESIPKFEAAHAKAQKALAKWDSINGK